MCPPTLRPGTGPIRRHAATGLFLPTILSQKCKEEKEAERTTHFLVQMKTVPGYLMWKACLTLGSLHPRILQAFELEPRFQTFPSSSLIEILSPSSLQPPFVSFPWGPLQKHNSPCWGTQPDIAGLVKTMAAGLGRTPLGAPDRL